MSLPDTKTHYVVSYSHIRSHAVSHAAAKQIACLSHPVRSTLWRSGVTALSKTSMDFHSLCKVAYTTRIALVQLRCLAKRSEKYTLPPAHSSCCKQDLVAVCACSQVLHGMALVCFPFAPMLQTRNVPGDIKIYASPGHLLS